MVGFLYNTYTGCLLVDFNSTTGGGCIIVSAFLSIMSPYVRIWFGKFSYFVGKMLEKMNKILDITLQIDNCLVI